MDRVTDIFDQDVQSEGSGDLDTDLVAAGHVLQKLAEEEGIDLGALPDKDVADLLGDLLQPSEPADKDPKEPQTKKEASMSTQPQAAPQTALPTEPTYADVSAELAKIAKAEGIDLTEVSREEFHEAFMKVAELMADPEFSKRQAAKVAEDEKLAAAYAQGQKMADGFLARLKEAEDEKEKAEKAEKEKAEAEKKAAAAPAGAPVTAGARLIAKVAGKTPDPKVAQLDADATTVAKKIATDLGFDPETGNVVQGASPEVRDRALAMLKEAGYLPK